ncbi:RNA helicase, ATP-dependent, SK12/DOB1 protein [Wolffia australiana]
MERISAGNDVAFRVGFSGHGGHLRLEPLPPVERENPLSSLPDFILPPAFEPETPERLKRELEEKYLSPELDIDEFSVEKSGRLWDFEWFERAKLHVEPSAPRVAIVPSWELPFRRKISESNDGLWDPNSVQVEVAELLEDDQHAGTFSLVPGRTRDFVRGSTSNRPFRPGGLEESQTSEKLIPDGARTGQWVRELIDGADPQTVAPSFKRGMNFGSLKEYPRQWKSFRGRESESLPGASEEKIIKFSVNFDDLFDNTWDKDTLEESTGEGESLVPSVSELTVGSKEDHPDVVPPINEPASLDAILSAEPLVLPPKPAPSTVDQVEQEKEAWIVTSDKDGIASRFSELVPDLALDFPFELDNFQKEAIYYLEKGESVFVAAHTSAGKTVVAEYAFALASKHCTRAVYTAPIKTISNQKYRDFCGKFDVGLLTGDVSLRPEASCLIMTTEILRSMLYRGADIIRDIEWVIFDEVHYVNDAERGVVWEEIIIMLPRHINFVLLSATVPNTIEFADWIGRTKKKKIVVTGTTRRPVPLEHCLFYSGEMYKVCENEVFLPQGVKAARDAFKKKATISAPGAAARGGASRDKRQSTNHAGMMARAQQNDWGARRASEASAWLQLINKLSKLSLLPVIIFCFSKTLCDKSADSMMGTDLTSSSEKSEIRLFCDKAFSRLKGSDRNLPQIIRVESFLRRGIGVHHAGLLPIVKEVVEMLFCRGVIKVLFCTETFAMGVNAPARTVVFANLKKFDGKEHRQLIPGEYIQMAGRAGRRGLDKIGTVIVMCRDQVPDESDLKHVMVGKPTRLESQFRLTYTMILHLLRIEELKVEDMLKRSFAEFHAQKNLPEKEKLLLLKLAQPTEPISCIKGEPAIEEYLEMYSEAEQLRASLSEAVAKQAAHFLSPGRVVIVRPPTTDDHFLGVILKTPSSSSKQYIALVLTADSWVSAAPPPPPPAREPSRLQSELGQGYLIAPKGKRDDGAGEYSLAGGGSRRGSGAVNIDLPYRGAAAGVNFEVTAVGARDLASVCDRRIRVEPAQLLEHASRAAFSKTVQELLAARAAAGELPPALDPCRDLRLGDVEVVGEYRRHRQLLREMAANKCRGCVKLAEHLAMARERRRRREEVSALRFETSDEALQQMPEFEGRVAVLRAVGCVDGELVVQMKGRVACEMNSGEELICAECLFENQLEDLPPEEAVALMSALVFQQRNAPARLTPSLAAACDRLHRTALRLGELQARLGVPVVPDDYARENLKFGLVQVVYEWAKGTAFAEICELTDVPEGMIVRTIVRLDETCREFRNAAAIMGNDALRRKMEAASEAIKRDIVFAASLYVTGV